MDIHSPSSCSALAFPPAGDALKKQFSAALASQNIRGGKAVASSSKVDALSTGLDNLKLSAPQAPASSYDPVALHNGLIALEEIDANAPTTLPLAEAATTSSPPEVIEKRTKEVRASLKIAHKKTKLFLDDMNSLLNPDRIPKPYEPASHQAYHQHALNTVNTFLDQAYALSYELKADSSYPQFRQEFADPFENNIKVRNSLIFYFLEQQDKDYLNKYYL
jgi:hypothetical protein